MLLHNRRNFLQLAGGALAGAAFLPISLNNVLDEAKKKKEAVGVQLYSVRDDMKANPMDTLKKLSDMGYRSVEHANYVDRKFYGYSATEFKKILDDLNLKMPSGHTVMGKQHWDASKNDFTDQWKWTVEDAATVGQKWVISPWLDESYRKNYDDLKKYMEVFNKSGELCKKSGMKFGYHNHHFEFAEKLNDVLVYDIILQNTDPHLVAQQLDVGNMYNGGGVAQDVLKKYPGRFELMHVKDEIASAEIKNNEKYESAVLGTGIINTKEVVDLGRKIGNTTQFIIEQESYQGKQPLDSMKEDLVVMKNWGYS